ncbi:MAG TPA: helix-turn-helix transcriptional regulator [Jatrophihabitantaceae bacterium]|jgi:transcriptional regulator with XRE-family HTH domain
MTAGLSEQPEALRRAVITGEIGEVVRLARVRAGLSQAELGQACGGYRQSTISRLEAGRVSNPDRRTLAKVADVLGIPPEWLGIASGVMGEPPSPAPQRAGQSAAGLLNVDARVTPRTVQALEMAIVDYWRRDDEFGGRSLYPAVAGHLRYVLDLLRYRTDAPLRRQLVGVGAELARLAGWMLFDSRHYATAARHYAQAADLARDFDDPAFTANVMASMSLQATYDGDQDEAVALGQAAEDVARATATPRVMALLAMRTAFALAAAGDRHGTHAALSRSERRLEQAHQGDDDPAWCAYFTEPKYLADLGIARARLAESAPAVPLLESALDRQDDRNHRLKAFHALWLGRAHLDLGELEQACQDGQLALRYARTIESPRIDRHLHEFRDALRPHDRVPAVRTFVADFATMA